MDYQDFEKKYDFHDSILNEIIIEPNSKSIIFSCTLLIPKKTFKNDEDDSIKEDVKLHFNKYKAAIFDLKAEDIKKTYKETILEVNYERKKDKFFVHIYTSVSEIKIIAEEVLVEKFQAEAEREQS